jgi:hypothetical protein
MSDNIIRKRILVTDLSQQLKKQRDFLKWMSRRHTPSNPEQGAAFTTGAELLEEIRQDLLAGLFDAEEVFTEEPISARTSERVGNLEVVTTIYGDHK